MVETQEYQLDEYKIIYYWETNQDKANMPCPLCKATCSPRKYSAKMVQCLSSPDIKRFCIYEEYKAYCPTCKKAFEVPHPDFLKGKHYATEVIQMAMNLRFKVKATLESIKRVLWRDHRIIVSTTALNNWELDKSLDSAIEEWNKTKYVVMSRSKELKSLEECLKKKSGDFIPTIFSL